MNTRYNLPATPRQLRYISILCMNKKIKTPFMVSNRIPLEENKMTFGEAGILISYLNSIKNNTIKNRTKRQLKLL